MLRSLVQNGTGAGATVAAELSKLLKRKFSIFESIFSDREVASIPRVGTSHGNAATVAENIWGAPASHGVNDSGNTLIMLDSADGGQSVSAAESKMVAAIRGLIAAFSDFGFACAVITYVELPRSGRRQGARFISHRGGSDSSSDQVRSCLRVISTLIDSHRQNLAPSDPSHAPSDAPAPSPTPSDAPTLIDSFELLSAVPATFITLEGVKTTHKCWCTSSFLGKKGLAPNRAALVTIALVTMTVSSDDHTLAGNEGAILHNLRDNITKQTLPSFPLTAMESHTSRDLPLRVSTTHPGEHVIQDHMSFDEREGFGFEEQRTPGSEYTVLPLPPRSLEPSTSSRYAEMLEGGGFKSIRIHICSTLSLGKMMSYSLF